MKTNNTDTENTLRIAVLGSTKGTSCGTLAESESLLGQGLVTLVVSNKPKTPGSILQRAEDANVLWCYIQGLSKSAGRTRDDFENELNDLLQEQQIDLIVMVGFMLILSKKFIKQWQGKILNVHPSLLPKYAGGMDLNVHEEVIKSGDKVSGCTVHIATEVADAGPILVQLECEVATTDTADTLKAKVQALEKKALVQAIKVMQKSPELYSGLDLNKGFSFTLWRKHIESNRSLCNLVTVGATVGLLAATTAYISNKYSY